MGPPLDSAIGHECEQAPALAVMSKKKVAAALATLSPEERADTLEEIEAEKQKQEQEVVVVVVVVEEEDVMAAMHIRWCGGRGALDWGLICEVGDPEDDVGGAGEQEVPRLCHHWASRSTFLRLGFNFVFTPSNWETGHMEVSVGVC